MTACPRRLCLAGCSHVCLWVASADKFTVATCVQLAHGPEDIGTVLGVGHNGTLKQGSNENYMRIVPKNGNWWDVSFENHSLVPREEAAQIKRRQADPQALAAAKAEEPRSKRVCKPSQRKLVEV
jgi:hypothetical protein